ncbi:hypothetical protein [Grimontia hollisae]|uniref:hypothetical protein n=1 Tax=Grimontia hollisae TaxID=673 RepID=UPI000DF8F909|nr:hypothetical protein [Grimontia hollisae]STQ75532.1 Uncharacterised protein [Grimontia hollisae]
MKRALLFLSAFLLSGCISQETLKQTYDSPGWPGYISSTTSEFDGKKTIQMQPAYLAGADSFFRLGIRWQSNWDANQFALVAEWSTPTNFSPDAPLRINVDGQFLTLEPIDPEDYGYTGKHVLESNGMLEGVHQPVYNYTEKLYWITRAQLQQIIDAQKSVVRVEFLKDAWEEQIEPTPEAMNAYRHYPFIWSKAGFGAYLSKFALLY